jgi:hypothetical protein
MLASLLKIFLQAKLFEAKTNNKTNHNRLGLQDISVEDSLARLVTVKVANQSWQVLIGNNVSVGEGSYIRLPKQSQSWRLDKNIDLPVESFSWLKHPILPYSSEDILSVARIHKNGWQMLKRADSELFDLLELPKGKALQYEGVLNGFVASLVELDYQELVAAEETFINTLEVLVELEVQTQEQGLFTVQVSQAKGLYYVSFAVDGNVVAAESSPYWQNWYYQISSYSAQQLNKNSEDFLTDPAKQNEPVNIQALDEGASAE